VLVARSLERADTRKGLEGKEMRQPSNPVQFTWLAGRQIIATRAQGALAKLAHEDATNQDITRDLTAATKLVEQYAQPSDTHPPKGWYAGGYPRYSIGVDQSVFHGGRASAYIKSVVPRSNAFGSLGQRISSEAYAGKRVRLGAFMKIQDVKDSATLWLRADASLGVIRALANLNDKPNGTSDWRFYELVIDIPSGTQLIMFGAMLLGPGELWVDDFVLEVVDSSVAATTAAFEPVNLQLEPGRHQ
jgi:hypothetical protein